MSVSILRIWSLWLVRKNMCSWRMDYPLFLSLAALLGGGTEDQTLAALLSSGKTALFKLSKEGKRILWISDKIRQSFKATKIGWSPYTSRGVDVRQQTVSDWMKLADFTSDSGIDRPVYLRICTHLPSQPLVSFFLLTISAFFLENWWWSFVQRDPTWTWWQRANGGLSWRRERPQSARRHLRSCCSSVKDRMSSAETEVHNLSQDTVWCGERWVTRHSSTATLPASTWNSSSSSPLW